MNNPNIEWEVKKFIVCFTIDSYCIMELAG